MALINSFKPYGGERYGTKIQNGLNKLVDKYKGKVYLTYEDYQKDVTAYDKEIKAYLKKKMFPRQSSRRRIRNF